MSFHPVSRRGLGDATGAIRIEGAQAQVVGPGPIRRPEASQRVDRRRVVVDAEIDEPHARIERDQHDGRAGGTRLAAGRSAAFERAYEARRERRAGVLR